MKKQKIISIILVIFVLITLISTIKPVQAVKENKENETIIIYDDGTKEAVAQQQHNLYVQKYINGCFNMLIGFVAGISLYTGIRTIMNGNKKLGIIQVILTFLAPAFTFLWCMRIAGYAFYENSFIFLLKTAFYNNQNTTIYEVFFSNLTLITYIILIILTTYNIRQIRKIKGGK